MILRRLPARVCALLAAGLVVPALAAAAWTPPVTLSPAGRPASDPRVAVDADGDAVFTWVRFDGANYRVQARARSAGGSLSGVQTLSAAGENASSPEVAIDPGGDAVFTWTRASRVQARARSAAGGLSPVQALSPADKTASDAGVAVDADGDAVFTWLRRVAGESFLVEGRARSAGGTLSAVQPVSEQAAYAPQVAVDPGGDAVFAWHRYDGSANRVETRARSATGTLSAVQAVSGRRGFDPQVAVDADGDAVFTWKRHDGTDMRVQARARSASGTLGAVQTLSAAGHDATAPQLGVEPDGDAVFIWQRNDGTTERIQARARSATGTLGAVQTLSAAGRPASDPEVAVEGDGDAVFTWQGYSGAYNQIQARTRAATGTLGAVQTLSAAGDDAFAPQLGVDAAGDAVITWGATAATGSRIQASAGP